MSFDGNDSECRGRNDAGSSTRTSSVSSGHGSVCAGGDSAGQAGTTKIKARSESLKELFEPIESTMDCPGGVCPVPWATKTDNVNHPSHYTDGSIECIEAIEAQLTREEYRGYLKGNIAKYVWRENHKGGVESLKKAQWYLDRLVKLE